VIKIITIEQKGDSGIIIFDRIDRKRIQIEIKDFKPYFYAEDDNGKYISIYDEKCKKIFTKSSKDVVYEKTKYSKTFENDIKYTDRYIIDCISTPIPKREIRKCYIDIENDDSLDTENTPMPITSLTVYDNFICRFICFSWRNDLKKEIKKQDEISFYYLDNEEELINNFIKFIKDTEPDMFIGFNVNFDLSYIINRAKKLNININQISPMKYTKIDKYGVKIYGCVVIDLRKLIKANFIKKRLYSYDLDTIAEHLISKKKIEVMETAGELWRNDIHKLIEYNIQDVKLLKEMDEQTGIIDFYDAWRREIGCGWDRITSFSYLHDMETYRYAKQFNFVIPKSPKSEFEQVEGADVMSPKAGMYKYLITMDIKSQYPYGILSCNISPETIAENGDIILDKTLRFKSGIKGLIPTIVEDEIKRRDESKKLMLEELRLNGKTQKYRFYNLVQYSNKVLINSWYSMFNTNYYVLKDRKLTEAITMFSRKSIRWSRRIVADNGYEVIYSDSDSLFIDSKANSPEEAKEIGEKLKKKINDSYIDFMNEMNVKESMLRINFDGIYENFFVSVKKRYFGKLIWNDGIEVNEMVIKGYEVIRVDTAKICKIIMEKVFNMLVECKSKEEIDSYIKITKEELKSNKYSLINIGMSKPYKKDTKVNTSQKKAVEFSNNYLNANIKENERILYVYGFIEGLPKTESFAFRNLKTRNKFLNDRKYKIDWSRMMPVLVDNKIEKLYAALGWNVSKEKRLLEFC